MKLNASVTPKPPRYQFSVHFNFLNKLLDINLFIDVIQNMVNHCFMISFLCVCVSLIIIIRNLCFMDSRD